MPHTGSTQLPCTHTRTLLQAKSTLTLITDSHMRHHAVGRNVHSTSDLKEYSAYCYGSLSFAHFVMVFIVSTGQVIHCSELYGWYCVNTRTDLVQVFCEYKGQVNGILHRPRNEATMERVFTAIAGVLEHKQQQHRASRRANAISQRTTLPKRGS